MGLKIYHNPDDDEPEAQSAAAKLDRAAAQTRSPIRREASIRPERGQSSSTGLTNIIRYRSELRQARNRARRENPDTSAEIELLEAELDWLRRYRDRNQNRLSSDEINARLVNHAERILDSSTEQGPNLYLPPLDETPRPQNISAENVYLPRPTRESNLRFELNQRSPQRDTAIPSPPLTDAASLSEIRNRPIDGPLQTWETTPPLTHGFAPARAAARTVDGERNGLETPPPETWENTYPPLRRVPHMSPRPLPRATVDGLGDRRRSPSPPSDELEEATWNTLLATMEGGSGPSSASTSFASMTDLISTSRTSSGGSSNTQNTSASFGEIGISADDMCDLPPGITEDDVRQIRDRHRRTGRRVQAPRRHIPEPDYVDLEEAASSTLRGQNEEFPFSALRRQAREVGEARDRRQRRHDELLMLQAIADRRQNLETVPDEWWALAGLPASMGRATNGE